MERLDLEEFWAEEALCRGKPFRTDKPRCPIELSLDDHWLLDALGFEDWRPYYEDPLVRAERNRLGNDLTDSELGIRPFSELVARPGPVRIEVVLGCRTQLLSKGTPWLRPAGRALEYPEGYIRELERMSDEDLAARVLPNHTTPVSGGVAWSRGPATIATSVFGTTSLMYLLIDEPDLATRFFKALAELLVRRTHLLDRASGSTTRGWAWLDDDCALFSPALFEAYLMPVHRRVFGEFAPGADDFRFQHSDSNMGHLLGLLAELNLTGVNFGPKLKAAEIRRAMPRAEIHGQIAPFTLRDGTPESIEAEVRRDFDAVGADGGLTLATAGSIPAGTSPASIRHFMSAVALLTRYDGGNASLE